MYAYKSTGTSSKQCQHKREIYSTCIKKFISLEREVVIWALCTCLFRVKMKT